MARPNIAFVESSLDGGSFEAQIAREAIAALGDRADVTVVDHRDLPLLNDSNAFPVPEAALAIRDKFQNADAVWVFTTEYHRSLPVSVKNLFDWLTSPKAAEDKSERTVLANKPVAITGVGGFKGMFGRIELGDLLEDNDMRVFPVEVGLSVPEEAFQTGEWVMSEGDIQAIKMQAEDFLTFINANDDHEEK